MVIIFISYRVPEAVRMMFVNAKQAGDCYCWAISLMYPDSGYYIRVPTRPTPHMCEQPGQKLKYDDP